LTLEKLTPSPPAANSFKPLIFRFSESTRQKNIDQFVQTARASDQSAGDELERTFYFSRYATNRCGNERFGTVIG
jgi:hypothetical protein